MERFLDILSNELDELLTRSDIRHVILEDEEHYVGKFLCTGEFLVTYDVQKDDAVLKKMTDAAKQVVRFKDLYLDGAFNVEIGKAFLDLPGVFTFVTDEVDIRLYRLLRIILEQTYGKHNIFAFKMEENCMRVDTRGGRFYFHYDNFNVSVKKEMELMNKLMRRPIRDRRRKKS